MQKIEIIIKNTDNIGRLEEKDLLRIQEVFEALIQTGGLTGVKGGQTIIHWDGEGNFMGINLNYWPYRKRKIDR